MLRQQQQQQQQQEPGDEEEPEEEEEEEEDEDEDDVPFPGGFVALLHHGLPSCNQLVYRPRVDPESIARALQSAGSKHPTSVTTLFTVPRYETSPGQYLVVVGSTPQLGAWDPARGVRMHWLAGHLWQGRAALPLRDDVQAKVGGGGQVNLCVSV